VEEHALLVECFSEVAHDSKAADAIKLWLLKQKQTEHWNSTKATAEACYALMCAGSNWLANEPDADIRVGNEHQSASVHKEAGTGYFKVKYDGAAVKPEMGDIKIKITGSNNAPTWGAAYWQYWDDMDKILGAASPLKVSKKLYIEEHTGSGKELQPITEDHSLKVGDKVTVRIEIFSDRNLEYVHLKDMRASCFEPGNVLSGYRYQGGLSYYENTKDASSNFFISYLPKGKYVFEYSLTVNSKGDFSNGITTIQCMYAPEFAAHTAGMRVTVK
jgi:uncharacterized protein YfaS (alpha-2-macroglobulin family)